MTGLVRSGGGGTPRPPSFQRIERFMDDLASVREAVTVAREPSAELLARLDAAIAMVEVQEPEFRRALVPGKIAAVGVYLAMLIDVYANSGQQNGESFGGCLVDDVMDLEPPLAAVEIACRRWRQRSKFRPAISEMLDEVRAAKARIANAQDFIAKLPAQRDRMARDLGAQ